jgi:IS30 family transposase
MQKVLVRNGILLKGKGRPPRDWPVDQIRLWVEVDGWTMDQVARKLGTHHQTVSKVCAKHGIRTQRTGPRAGEGHPKWEGGRILDKHGYVLVYRLNHPMARKRGKMPPIYVPEHRLVMSEHLGRMLDPLEVVHHKNGEKQDNRLENLELYTSNALHLEDELTGRCPKWSEAGKQAIRLGVKRRWAATRKGSGSGDPSSK